MVTMTDDDWKHKAKGLLKSEIVKRNLSYVDVAERLKQLGIEETPKILAIRLLVVRLGLFLCCRFWLRLGVMKSELGSGLKSMLFKNL